MTCSGRPLRERVSGVTAFSGNPSPSQGGSLESGCNQALKQACAFAHATLAVDGFSVALSPGGVTRGLKTTPTPRRVIADTVRAGARYLIATDVDDFAIEDLAAYEMSAVNLDCFMALRYTETAYREGVETLVAVRKNPARTHAEAA